MGWPTAHCAAEVGDEVLKSTGPTTMTARKAIRDFLAESRYGTVRRDTAEPLHRQAQLNGATMLWKIHKVPNITSVPTRRPQSATRTNYFRADNLSVNREDCAVHVISGGAQPFRQQPSVKTPCHGCVFRGHAPSNSDLMRPPIPILSAHRFRGMRPPL